MRECIFGVIFPSVLTLLAFAMHRKCDGSDIFDVHGFTKNLQRMKFIVAALLFVLMIHKSSPWKIIELDGAVWKY